MIETNALKGRYKLISCIGRSEAMDIHPFGENPRGQLIYTSEQMMVYLESSQRAPLSKLDARSCSPEEIFRTFNEFECYNGSYELQGDALVVHHVESSKNPNLCGMDLARKVKIDGNLLHLDTVDPLPVNGVDFHFLLTWEKVESL